MALLTVKDVAAKLNVSAACVYALAESGKLVGYKIGLGRGTWRFAEEDVQSFLNAARQNTPRRKQPTKRAATFQHLNGERLREAWKKNGVPADRSGD